MVDSCPHRSLPGGLEGRGGLAGRRPESPARPLSTRAVRRVWICRAATASPPRASISRVRARSRRARLRSRNLRQLESLNAHSEVSTVR